MANRKYIQICRNENVLALPTIDKIQDGILTLEHYKLNVG
jgi:hypothetical protein